MALYLVKRTDPVDYDEYDAIVVRAPSEGAAGEMAVNGHGEFGTQGSFRRGQFTVTLLAVRGPAEVILGSFNAG